LLEAGKNADGQTGETGGKVSVCKETFLIRPPAREKSNYLSVIRPPAREKSNYLSVG